LVSAAKIKTVSSTLLRFVSVVKQARTEDLCREFMKRYTVKGTATLRRKLTTDTIFLGPKGALKYLDLSGDLLGTIIIIMLLFQETNIDT
jgi:hypothetical protein